MKFYLTSQKKIKFSFNFKTIYLNYIFEASKSFLLFLISNLPPLSFSQQIPNSKLYFDDNFDSFRILFVNNNSTASVSPLFNYPMLSLHLKRILYPSIDRIRSISLLFQYLLLRLQVPLFFEVFHRISVKLLQQHYGLIDFS